MIWVSNEHGAQEGGIGGFCIDGRLGGLSTGASQGTANVNPQVALVVGKPAPAKGRERLVRVGTRL